MVKKNANFNQACSCMNEPLSCNCTMTDVERVAFFQLPPWALPKHPFTKSWRFKTGSKIPISSNGGWYLYLHERLILMVFMSVNRPFVPWMRQPPNPHLNKSRFPIARRWCCHLGWQWETFRVFTVGFNNLATHIPSIYIFFRRFFSPQKMDETEETWANDERNSLLQ